MSLGCRPVALYLIVTFALTGFAAATQSTTSTLSVSPNPLAPGAVATLTATVTAGVALASGGTVTFLDGKRVLGTAQVVAPGTAAGTATIKTRSFQPGQHSLTAQYGGAANGSQKAAGSTSAPVTLAVQGLTTATISISERPNHGTPGTYDLTAAVTGTGSQIAPTGTVTFTSGGTQLGSAQLGQPQTTQAFATTPVNFPDNGAITQVVSADFNQDGFPDLAGITGTGNAVTELLGDPANPGKFLAPTTFQMSGSASAIVTGDFNNDGWTDVAVLHAGTVGILLGDPSHPGQFLAETTFAAISNPVGLVIADFNGDGLLDLAVAGAGGQICVLLGDAASPGTFLPAAFYKTPGIPSAIAVGDFNGDGVPDLAIGAGTYASDTDYLNTGFIAVLFGDPNQPGTFPNVTVVTYPPTVPSLLAVADFNNDGVPDIAYSSQVATTTTVGLLSGDPSHPGQFLSPVQVYTASSFGPLELIAADFNNDGLPDLALGISQTVLVLFNQSASPGTFVEGYSYTLSGAANVTGLLGTDLNGDEIPDIVLAEPTETDGIAVLFSSEIASTEAFLDAVSLPAGSQALGAAYSGDNNYSAPAPASLSAAIANPTVTTLAISPNGSLAKGMVITLTATVNVNGQSVTAGKVKFLDGKRLLGSSQVTSSGNTVLKTDSFNPGTHSLTAVFEGTPHGAQGSFAASVSSAVGLTITGQATSGVALVESTHDRNLVNYNFTAIVGAFGLTPPTGTIALQDTTTNATLASGTLASSNAGIGFLPPVASPPSSAVYGYAKPITADFNGDGIPDVATVDYLNSAGLDIFLGDPNHPGQFVKGTSVSLPGSAYAIVTADFNGDGVPDIAVLTTYASNLIQILLGDPANPGQFQPPVGYSFFPASVYKLAVGDLNGDGLPDLIVGGYSTAIVFLNNPAAPGQFLAGSQYGFNADANIYIADLNVDGAPDIVSGGAYLPGDPANPGQFLTPVSLNFAANTILQAVADINADGLPDLVTLNATSVQIYLNHRANPGEFTPGTTLPFTSAPSALTSADVNGDGIIDLIVGVQDISVPGYVSPQSGVQVFLGDSSNPGQFIAQPVRPYFYLAGYTFGDFNGDGILDLATSIGPAIDVSLGADIASTYFGNTPVTAPGSNIVTAAYSGDSNYASSTSPTLTINVPVSSTTVLSASPLNASLGTTITLTAVVTISGKQVILGTVQFVDGTNVLGTVQVIAAGNQTGSAIFETRLGLGSHTLTAVYSGAPLSSQFSAGSTSAPVMISISGAPQTATSLTVGNPVNRPLTRQPLFLTAAVSTFNQTAATGSVIFSDLSQRVTLGELPLSSAGTRGFTAPIVTAVTDAPFAASLAIGDLNGDGVPDLAVADGGVDGASTVLLANPQNPGTFQNQVVLSQQNSPNGHITVGVAIADMNADGVPDLVSCENSTAFPPGNAYPASVEVFFGIRNEPEHFASPIDEPLYVLGACAAIQTGDLTRDGLPDVAALTNLGFLSSINNNFGQPGTFYPNGSLNVGSNQQLQIADFNNDGLPDALTGGGSIELSYGNPDTPGYFQAPITIGTGNVISTGDFNGDGLPDIAYAGAGNLVTVLLSVAGQPGTFQAAATYAAGNGIVGLAVGDFNGDGHPDLAVANGSDSTISVLTNDPNHPGQFLPQAVYATAAKPTYLAAADMNGDGYSDLVVLDQAANVEVLLSSIQTSVTLSNVTLLAGGYHDLQAAFRPANNRFGTPVGASNSNVVQIVLPSTPLVTLSANPTSLALGSVVTLVATVTLNNGISENVRGGVVEFSDGPRSLGTAQVVISGAAQGTATLRSASFGPGTHMITAKYDGVPRGPIPLLSATSAPASLTVSGLAPSTTSLVVNPDPSNNANSAFQATVLGFSPDPPTGAVNFANNTASATLGSIPLSRSPSFSCGSALTSPLNLNIGFNALVSGDFNNDGVLDTAVVNGGVLEVAFGDPSHPGQFLPETDYTLMQPVTSPAILAADFNGDGVLDLAVGTFETSGTGTTSYTTAIFLGNPANPGQFQSPETVTLGGPAGQLFSADFNGDGLPDLAYFDLSLNTMTVTLADPNHPGQFLPGIVASLPGGYQQMAIADMNHDGLPDLVLTSASQPSGPTNLLVMLADPKNPGQFVASTSIGLGIGVSAVSVADFNSDGLPDVLVIQNSNLVLYANDQSNPGHFLPSAPAATQPLTATIYGDVANMSAYDMNGDGLLDLVLWDSFSDSFISLNDAANPGHFLTPNFTNTITFNHGGILIGDFNSDGLPDLLEEGRTNTTIIVYPGGLSVTVNLDNIALPAPNQSVVAEYSGDSDYQPSASNTVTAPFPMLIDTYLYFGPLPKTVYTGATFVVSAVAVGQGILPISSGSITFTLTDPSFNNTSLGTVQLNAAGYASIPVTVLAPGSYSISANYSGTSVWTASSNTIRFIITANAQATSLIEATPNPILVPTGSTTGSTSLSWTVTGATTTEVHTNSPSGPLVASGASSNSGVAVSSVSDGTIFYLQDTSNGKALALPNTLDTVMVHVRTAPVFSATPNPMILATGALTGTTLLQWNAPSGVTAVEIHQGSFNGPLIGGGGASGSAAALGIAPGTVFYLQNTTGGQSLSAAGTLGIITVQ